MNYNVSLCDENMHQNFFINQSNGFSRNRKANLSDMNKNNIYKKMDIYIPNWNISNETQIYNKNNKNQINRFNIREFTSERTKRNPNIGNLVATLYGNFIELSKYPILKHNQYEIHRLLTSPNLIMFTAYNGNSMIAYLIGEMMKLNDGRKVLYISYLYVSSKYRNLGLGDTLLNTAIQRASLLNANSVVLITDTEDQKVFDFYMKKGFMYDTNLRRYDKYDVLSLQIKSN